MAGRWFLAVVGRHAGWPRPRVLAGLGALVLLAGLVTACAVSKRVDRDPWRHLGPAPVADLAGARPVRVGLAEDQPRSRLTASGAWELRAGRAAEVVASLAAREPLEVWNDHGRVRFAGDGPAGRTARLIAAPADSTTVLLWDGRPWRGQLHVIATPGGDGVTVINVLPLASYLAGVLPREIGRGRPPRQLAAVAAQAVAARTYVAGRLGGRARRGFDVFADVRDQVYGGAAVEDSLCNVAIARTAGLVLRRPDGQLADAFFHSTCGGHTAAKDQVWPTGPDPLLGGVPDARPDGAPWCAASKYSRWTVRWRWSELEEILARTLPAYLRYLEGGGRAAWRDGAFTATQGRRGPGEPGPLQDLAITARTPAGRVAVLEITCAAGRYRVRGDQTRRVLVPPGGRPSMLRSAWFDLEVRPGQGVVARGRGWGHGLGLCQMGALGRAEAGQDAATILAHYYPGARVEPLDPEALP